MALGVVDRMGCDVFCQRFYASGGICCWEFGLR